MDKATVRALCQQVQDIGSEMGLWSDRARLVVRDATEALAEVERLQKENAMLKETCQAALAIHDRYCDRVGASDNWARSVHNKLRAAIEAASEQA
jgi:hypothetical protein